MAHDELVDEFASSRSDLADPAKNESLVRLLRQRGVGDQEIVSLLEQLRGGVTGEQRSGKSTVRDQLSRFLRSKGMLSEDDILTAIDLALGIGKSARMGGNLGGGNFGGAPHSEINQPNIGALTDPASRDRALTYEESAGVEPCRDSRTIGGRDSFEELFARQDRVAQIREATRSRKPQTANAMAMDSKRAENFHTRFPEARRIRNAI
jgi:hypothetical protein